MKKKLIIIAVLALVAVIGLYVQATFYDSAPEPAPSTLTVSSLLPTAVTTTTLPKQLTLEVPYTVQAPEASWNLHEESCEEAAVLMYHYFLNKTDFSDNVIPAAQASSEMMLMKKWQVNRYGNEPDLRVRDLGEFAKEYYGYRYEYDEETTKEDIMRAISRGKPVIVPVITHALQNPHYGPNPSYHVLLIKGYREDGVITNDAGVKEGKDFFYSWEILFSAVNAQTAEMDQGREMITLISG